MVNMEVNDGAEKPRLRVLDDDGHEKTIQKAYFTEGKLGNYEPPERPIPNLPGKLK